MINSDEGVSRVVTARLPSGTPVQLEVTATDAGDGMTSVGLRDLDLGGALDAVAEIGSAVVEKLKLVRPTRALVELRLGFTVESGKLVALWLSGKGDASLAVTLEWSEAAPSAGTVAATVGDGDG